jgi:myo-inositol-1(or 4)-monophosphatase
MQPLLNIAIGAARAAGNMIIRYINRIDSVAVQSKRRNDFVSEVDRLAEREIIAVIRRAYPQHAILAEESGGHGGSDEYQWLVDPLDGTTNFLHGFPQYAVSIALKHRDSSQLGVVYDPFKEELFTAYRGAGATLNSRRIRVSQATSLSGALLGTGIPYRPDQDLDAYLVTLKALMPDTAGIRRAGSAALDLAYVACGRLDGFWEFGLRPWDMAAGTALVQEAGGMLGDISGGSGYLNTGNIVAASPKVFQAMIKTLRPQLAAAAKVNRGRAQGMSRKGSGF